MNDDITADSVRLIDADGEQVGVVSVAEGLEWPMRPDWIWSSFAQR